MTWIREMVTREEERVRGRKCDGCGVEAQGKRDGGEGVPDGWFAFSAGVRDYPESWEGDEHYDACSVKCLAVTLDRAIEQRAADFARLYPGYQGGDDKFQIDLDEIKFPSLRDFAAAMAGGSA